MKRWVLVAATIAGGVVLAFLLFPRPDTGQLPNAGGRAGHDDRPGPVHVGRPPLERQKLPGAGPSPIAMENIKRMNLPDALYAGRLTSPLMVIRRDLQLRNEASAEELGRKIDPLIGLLREQRRNPEAHSLPDLIAQARAWLDEVKASEFATDPEISAQFPRFDQFVQEYEQAKANPDAPPIGPPAGPPPSAPQAPPAPADGAVTPPTEQE